MGQVIDGNGEQPIAEGPDGPLLIGICGGSGSGKTTLAARLVDALGATRASRFSFDAYYRELSHLSVEQRAATNFDHPDSLDADLLVEHLIRLREGRDVAVPVYDFTTHARTDDLDLVSPRPFVIVEGVLLFAFPEIRQQLDFRVFRQCAEQVRADRRFQRDVVERGRTPESVRHQWQTTVQPMYEIHVEPYAEHADLVVDGEDDLDLAVATVAAALTGHRPALAGTH